MNEEQMPGTSSADKDVNRRWRKQSAEEPSGLLDARIRAAARQAIANRAAQGGDARRSSPWTRFVPLAAAASVALLAVGLVLLIPREEYQPLLGPGPGAEARNGEAMARRERPHRTESLRAPALEQESGRADEPATGVPHTSDRNLTPQTTARPSEAFGGAPRSKATAPAAASAAISEGVPLSSHDALGPAIPEMLAAQVSGDAARRTGADPASIRIVAVEPAAWPDSSLGCDPQGEHAEEVRVPGYLVTVQAPGTTLRYHTDNSDRIAVCEGE